MMTSRFKFGIASTLILSGFLPIAGSFFVLRLFGWGWTNEPLHSIVEATGALIALVVAVLLLQMRGRQDAVHFTWIASALIGMGLLDGFHSVLHAGSGFVRAHSLATLVGGLLFSLIYLPDRIARTRLAKSLPGLVAIATTVIGILLVTFRNQLPAMVNESGFTPIAKAVNLSGGMFFIAAGICFSLRYQERGRKDDLLFANLCLLFGVPGLLFVYSTLWDAAWWYWHLLRLLAYFVVLGYAFSLFLRLQEELRGSETRSRALLNAIPDLIIRFDLDGTLLDFQAHADSPDFKPPPPMIVGANIDESPMRREVVNQIMGASRRAVETGDAQTVEFAYPKESELRHYEARIVASGANELVATVRNITERWQAAEASQKERDFVSAVLDTVGALVVVLDSEGRIARFNRACERASGYSSEEVNGRHVWDFLLIPEEIDPVRAVFEELRSAHFPSQHENYWVSKYGDRRLIAWSNTALQNHDGKVTHVIATGIDITERKRMEEVLRRREWEFRFLADNVPGLFSYVDSEQRYRFVNKSYENAHALPKEQIIGRHVREILGDVGYELARKHIETALSGQQVTYEASFPLASGTRWMTVVYIPDVDDFGKVKGFFTLVSDITERKRIENELRRSREELRVLTGRLLSAKEEESKRLARELHDVFSQRLAVLGMEVSALEQQLASLPLSLTDRLRLMGDEIGSLAKDVHELSRQLHPSILDDLGLATALRAECAAFSKQHGIPAKFMPNNVPESLPSDISLNLYRIAQESLWNAAKHAEAKEVLVTLTGTGEEIVLAIHDDGNGFDREQIKGKGGLGLVSMGERCRMVNGSFSVTSEPGGKGTSVEVRIPWSGSGN